MQKSNYILFFILISWMQLTGQDLHFSQYYHHPLYQNPALTGVLAEDYRVHAIYRSQWQSVPVPYLTFAGSFDTKLFTPNLKKGRLGGGILLNSDRSGDANFTTIQVGGSGSYAREINKTNWISLGLQMNLTNQSFQPDRLTYDEQFDGESFNESISSTETFERTNVTVCDIGAGLNYQIRTKKTLGNVGISYTHIIRPNQQFLKINTTKQLPRVNVHSGGRVWLGRKIGYSCGAFFSFQGLGEAEYIYREAVIHAGVMYRLKREADEDYILHPGLHWRVGESVIPHIEVARDNWRVMVSYDITISDFIAATQRQGGIELALRYVWKRVVPPPKSKACPVF